MGNEADLRVIKLVRQLDEKRQELFRERQRSSALQAQNTKLRRAVALLMAERQKASQQAAC